MRIYGVNYKDQPAAARRFLGRYGNPFTAVGVDSNGRAAIDWGVYGMPETFVIDGGGRVAFKHVGPISAESSTRYTSNHATNTAATSAVAPALFGSARATSARAAQMISASCR